MKYCKTIAENLESLEDATTEKDLVMIESRISRIQQSDNNLRYIK